MWLRVAALIGDTVEELQHRMTSEEFDDWCAFYQLEPWGYEIANWRMGVIGSTVANYSGRLKKPVKPSDFLPRKPRKKTPKEMREMWKQAEKRNG
jgi:hypothetical protein